VKAHSGRLTRLTFLLVFLPGFVAAGNAQDLGSAWAIRGAVLIDGRTDTPIHDAVVVGSRDRITCAGTAASCVIPAGARVVDAAGKWLLPGLIDTHVHPRWVDAASAAREQRIRFAYGITTTRDAGSLDSLDANLAHRATAADRLMSEPRLIVSALLDREYLPKYGTTGYPDLVTALAAAGADAIKIKEPFSPEMWKTIVSRAHAAGVPVWGHTWTIESEHFTRAADAGIDGVTHMATFSVFGTTPEREDAAGRNSTEYWLRTRERWLSVDKAALESATRTMVAKQIWFEPTIAIDRYFTLSYPIDDYSAFAPPMPSLWDQVRPFIPAGGGSRWALADRRRRIDAAFDRMCEFLHGLADAHVRFVTGTDTGPAGVGLSDEIEFLSACGLGPMRAIQAATSDAAVALRRDDIGTIAPGKLADFVVVSADPLRNAANLRIVWRVVKGGVMYHPPTLLWEVNEANQLAWWSSLRWRLAEIGAAGLVLGLATVAMKRLVMRRRR